MGASDDCPICQLYALTAHAAALLEDLVQPSAQQGQVPAGLGGTIPLARRDLNQAIGLLPQVSQMTGWDLRQLRDCLYPTQNALGVWLAPGGVAAVAVLAKECRRQAYNVTGSYYMARAAAAAVRG